MCEVLQHMLGSSRTRVGKFANTCLEVRERVFVVREDRILVFTILVFVLAGPW